MVSPLFTTFHTYLEGHAQLLPYLYKRINLLLIAHQINNMRNRERQACRFGTMRQKQEVGFKRCYRTF